MRSAWECAVSTHIWMRVRTWPGYLYQETLRCALWQGKCFTNCDFRWTWIVWHPCFYELQKWQIAWKWTAESKQADCWLTVCGTSLGSFSHKAKKSAVGAIQKLEAGICVCVCKQQCLLVGCIISPRFDKKFINMIKITAKFEALLSHAFPLRIRKTLKLRPYFEHHTVHVISL